MANEELSKEEQARYSRHLIMPEIGKEGQAKLKNAKVLIIGAGGLGNPAAIYLAAAGVGTIGIIDFDKVDISNLQRQTLYSGEDIGKPKAAIMKKQLEKINNNIKIITYDKKLTSNNALNIIKNYDIIIDGSDNFPTRYLVNDACVLSKKPLVYGSVYRFDGQASVFNYNNGPCYRCLFSNPPPAGLMPNCEEAGVLGVLPGMIGMVQATESLKIILGKGKILSGRLLVYNAMSMAFMELNVKKNKNCPICSENPSITSLIDYEDFCNKKAEKDEITAKKLKEMIGSKEDFILVDTREKAEQDMCKIENAKLASFTEIARGNLKIFDNIGKDKKIVLYCHTGNRSAYVLNILKKKGYNNAKNLIGGIDAWAREIDNSIIIY